MALVRSRIPVGRARTLASFDIRLFFFRYLQQPKTLFSHTESQRYVRVILPRRSQLLVDAPESSVRRPCGTHGRGPPQTIALRTNACPFPLTALSCSSFSPYFLQTPHVDQARKKKRKSKWTSHPRLTRSTYIFVYEDLIIFGAVDSPFLFLFIFFQIPIILVLFYLPQLSNKEKRRVPCFLASKLG